MYIYFKHIIDKVIALATLLVLLPFMMLIILCYFPSFDFLFLQVRVGKSGKKFRIYKFRTLVRNKDSDDERRFFLGNILRKLSIDELPQLINILKGEMSFIGPRPLLPEYLEYYSEQENRRHLVKPGISGWAQVNGRNMIGWEERFELDVFYVDNISFKLDFSIFLKTVATIFKKDKNYGQKKFYRQKSR